MNTDFRVATTFPTHRKTTELIRGCRPHPGWSLVVLWSWVALHRPEGDLAGLPDPAIEAGAQWFGEPGAFIAALVAAGFMDGGPGARSIHDWPKRNAYAAGAAARSRAAATASDARWRRENDAPKRREMKIARQAKYRASKKLMRDASPTLHTPSPVPSPYSSSPTSVRPSDELQQGTHPKTTAVAVVPPVRATRDGFADYCYRTWQDKHDETPPWGKAEYACIAAAEKRCRDRPRAERSWDAFIASDDPFYAGHDPKKFLNTISTWLTAKDGISAGLLPRRTVNNIRAGQAWLAGGDTGENRRSNGVPDRPDEARRGIRPPTDSNRD